MHNTNTFTFRLDKRTNQKLDMLALRTYRSRAGVLRLLINFAALNRGLVFSNAGDSIADIDNNDALLSITGENMEAIS